MRQFEIVVVHSHSQFDISVQLQAKKCRLGEGRQLLFIPGVDFNDVAPSSMASLQPQRVFGSNAVPRWGYSVSFYISYRICLWDGMETRKVQVMGGITYVVSLPKKWAKQAGLKPNERVFVIPKSANEISIVTQRIKEKMDKKRVVEIIADSRSFDETLRLIVAYYLAGHTRIRIRSKKIAPPLKSMIEETTWRFMGLEITKESGDEIYLTSMLDQMALTIPEGIERMHRLASSMQNDSLAAFVANDKELACDAIRRDMEVDRLNFFIIRQIVQAQENYWTIAREIGINSPQELPCYRSVVKDLEKIGDFSVAIARLVPSQKGLPRELVQKLLRLGELANATHAKALEAFIKNDMGLANRAVESKNLFIAERDKLLKDAHRVDPRTIANLCEVIHKLSEIAARGGSISNEAFNKCVIS